MLYRDDVGHVGIAFPYSPPRTSKSWKGSWFSLGFQFTSIVGGSIR